MVPLTLLWRRPWQRNATQHAASVAIQRRSVCERSRSVSPPNDPSKNWPAADRPTAALGHTSVETRMLQLALPSHPCRIVYVDHQR